jgi:WD40 repeat protein
VVERGSSVAVSPSGRYFVLSSSSGSTLLDAATNSSLLNVSGAFAGFTPDENVMITLGQGVRLFSIPDGELIRTIGVNPCNGVYALHPSGSVLLAAGDLKTLSAVSLEDGKVIRSFFIDNPQEFGLTEKLQMAFMEGAREKHIAEGARRTSERTGLPGDTGLPISAEGSRHLRFSADGRLLFCATIHGAWVFDWEALLASPERSPRARYHYQSSTETPSGWWELYLGDSLGRQVFSLDHDPVNNRLLMACGDGNVRQIDLATGEASVLLAMPDLVPVCHVGLSPGGGLLCTIESSAFKKMQLEMEALMGGDRSAASVEKETPPVLRIWDYRKLSG